MWDSAGTAGARRASSPPITVAPGMALFAHRTGLLAGGFVTVASVLVLVGWALGYPLLTSLAPGYTAMKPNTAISLMGIGIALLTLARGGPAVLRRVACAVPLAISAITLAEYAFGWDARIDETLFRDTDLSTRFPGRMALSTGLCLLLLSISLMTRGALRPVRSRRTDILVLASMVVSYLALIGYVYGASSLYQFGSSTYMALNTSVTLLLASAGALAIEPERGIASILVRASAGGVATRRLVPLSLIGLPLIGLLRLAGQKAGWYDTEFGVALMVVSAATLIIAATVQLAWTLDHAHRSQLHAEARALTDELTGLPNRRLVEMELARLDDAAARHGRPYSIMAIDADGLKRINDTYGHGFGDLALRNLASAMAGALRTADIIARVGGDEFIALLPDTDAANARLIADRLREALEHTESEGDATTLTASIGISTWSRGWNGPDVIADADRALYAVKSERALAR